MAIQGKGKYELIWCGSAREFEERGKVRRDREMQSLKSSAFSSFPRLRDLPKSSSDDDTRGKAYLRHASTISSFDEITNLNRFLSLFFHFFSVKELN